jgi:hypothetical protein
MPRAQSRHQLGWKPDRRYWPYGCAPTGEDRDEDDDEDDWRGRGKAFEPQSCPHLPKTTAAMFATGLIRRVTLFL